MKPTEKCIYCGHRGKLTREHIYGRWARSLADPNVRTRHTVSTTERSGLLQNVTISSGPITRNYHPIYAQLKIVCRKCNETWLGQIQERAKPILKELAAGQWRAFSEEDIKCICSWMKMVVIALEFGHPPTAAVTESDRKQFYRTQTIGDNWYIYVGRCSIASLSGNNWHRGALISELSADDAPETCNFQSTLVHFGHVFFIAISAPPQFLPDPTAYGREMGIRQIWPTPQLPINPPLFFSKEGVDRAAMVLWREAGNVFGNPTLNHGPHGIVNTK